MTEEDVELIEKCDIVLEDLHTVYDNIELTTEEEQEGGYKRNPHLEILTCETIIEECKEEVAMNSTDDIQATLNLVYHMKLGEGQKDTRTLIKLDEVTEKFLSSSKHNQIADESTLSQYRKDIDLIIGIKTILYSRLEAVKQEKKWYLFPKSILAHKYATIIEEFSALEARIQECFAFTSEIISTYIIESFHYVYLYFSYIIKYFLQSDNQLVLVEIAASIDRFINVLQPLVKSTSLKNENLRNFYVIYEFKVLKDRIIKHYE